MVLALLAGMVRVRLSCRWRGSEVLIEGQGSAVQRYGNAVRSRWNPVVMLVAHRQCSSMRRCRRRAL